MRYWNGHRWVEHEEPLAVERALDGVVAVTAEELEEARAREATEPVGPLTRVLLDEQERARRDVEDAERRIVRDAKRTDPGVDFERQVNATPVPVDVKRDERRREERDAGARVDADQKRRDDDDEPEDVA